MGICLLIIISIVIVRQIKILKNLAADKGYTFSEYIKMNKFYFSILVIFIALMIFWVLHLKQYSRSQYENLYHNSIMPSGFSSRFKQFTFELNISNERYDEIYITGNPIELKKYGEEGYLIFKNADSDTFYIKKDSHIKFFIIEKP